MLTLIIGIDWIANQDKILSLVTKNVKQQKAGNILIVPELISHDMERRLCKAAGDTCSRFAEVVTFSRLVKRVTDYVGVGAQECLDNGGRVVAMASAARQLHTQLKAYAAVESKPEFLTDLVDAIDEFKRCCISSEDLLEASSRTEGAFSQKLQELGLLLASYDGLCARGKRDPRDLMTWVLEQLEDSDFAEKHSFFVDGFPDFTRQHLAILEHFIENSQEVFVSLTCDSISSNRLSFEKAGQTAAQLIKLGKKHQIPVKTLVVPPRKQMVSDLSGMLFQGKIRKITELSEKIHTSQPETVFAECNQAAGEIMDLVEQGARYRDIGIVCGDLPNYRNVLQMVFSKCRIPLYLSGTEDILEKSVIHTVLSALDAALGGFQQRDVLLYFKSALSPLDLQLCDRLENYAVIWNINGAKWFRTWTGHPDGLEGIESEESAQRLMDLNAQREFAMRPLHNLFKGFEGAVNLRQQVQSLYHFLEEIQLDRHLAELAETMDHGGDNRSAQVLNQLWDILLSALEQIYDVLGDTSWDNSSFVQLFKLLLSQYDVGTIPPVLDTVTAGASTTMRCQHCKYLFVLGAAEGNFPGYGGSSGILTDQERVAMRSLDLPLTGGSVDGLQAEFADIYGVFCGAEKEIFVSCPAGQPSFVFKRLEAMGEPIARVHEVSDARSNTREAASFLLRNHQEHLAESVGCVDELLALKQQSAYTMGTMERETVEKLYGKQLMLSASQIDRQAECRFSYFLQYGLRAKERKAAEVNPAEFGTYVHAVLEHTGNKIMEMGGFHKVSLEDTEKIAENYSDIYAREHFQSLDSQRVSYLFKRNCQELKMVVEELWTELEQSKFEPLAFELGFGNGQTLPAISIPGNHMGAFLRGFVDRIDQWKENGQNYYRVVDYKTGKKDFDYCDVFNGIGLQMLLYLFALEESGEILMGKAATAAGVQYFPARAPFIKTDGLLNEEDAAKLHLKEWKRKGLLLEDEQVIDAMDPSETSERLCCSRKKDGSLKGDLADRNQMRQLKKYVYRILAHLVDQIASGCVTPNPYTRGVSHDACAFCPYGEVCHQAEVEDRRNYKVMSSAEFWDAVQKEVAQDD